MLSTEASFNIPGPSPVGTTFLPISYSDWNMRQIQGVITSTVGQFNYSFLTNLRLDESKIADVIWSPNTFITGGVTYVFEAFPDVPTFTYQPQNLGGYNWLIQLTFLLKNSAGATIDFPAGAFPNITIKLNWAVKGSE